MTGFIIWIIGFGIWIGYEPREDFKKSWFGSIVFFFCWPIRLGELLRGKE